MSKENLVKSPAGRPRRTSISGKRNILTVRGKEPGYEYRFVNDEGDRISEFLDQGWELVPADSVKVGEKRIDNATAEGSKAQVSVGGGTKAYLMRIKDDWYKEDQIAKQREVNELEASTRQKALDGTYGKLEITRD